MELCRVFRDLNDREYQKFRLYSYRRHDFAHCEAKFPEEIDLGENFHVPLQPCALLATLMDQRTFPERVEAHDHCFLCRNVIQANNIHYTR